MKYRILTISSSQSNSYFVRSTFDNQNIKNIDSYLSLEQIKENTKIHKIIEVSSINLVENFDKYFLKIGASSISYFIIDSGPGSFTGLRTTYAFIKGISSISKISVYPVTILDSICIQKYLSYKELNKYASIDARNGNVYHNTLNIKNIGNMKYRNIIQFKNQNKYDFISSETIKSMTYLGVFDILNNRSQPIKTIIPLYGKEVNIG